MPTKFGQVQNLNTLSDNYGKQIDHWNGFDISVNARLQNGLMLQGGVGTGKQIEDNCEIVAKLPEMLNSGRRRRGQHRERAGAVAAGAVLPSRGADADRSSRRSAIYIIPKIDVQVSGSFRSTPGTIAVGRLHRDQRLPRLRSRRSAARSRATAANVVIGIEKPNEAYTERRQELDMRIGKVLRFGNTKTVVSMDLYNALNSNAMIVQNQAYASYLRPVEILNARLIKFSLGVRFLSPAERVAPCPVIAAGAGRCLCPRTLSAVPTGDQGHDPSSPFRLAALTTVAGAGSRARHSRNKRRPLSIAARRRADDLTGIWVSLVTEEWRWRMTTPPKGDYISLPLSDEGAAWPTPGPGDRRQLQGLRRRRRDVAADAAAHLVGRRSRRSRSRPTPASRRGCSASMPREPPARAACRASRVAAWEPIGGAPVLRNGSARRRHRRRRRHAEGRDHEPERRLAAAQRRALQRAHDADRVLGPRGVSQRRRLPGRHDRRRAIRAYLAGEYTTQRALQARARRLEVAARAVPRRLRSRRHANDPTALCCCRRRLLALPCRAARVAQGPRRRAAAMVDLAGSWAMSNDEELLIRIDPGPELENYTGFPLNAAGRQKALTWNSTIQAVPEHQARPHPAQYSMRGPGPNFHMGEMIDPTSRQLIAYTITGLFENANRTIWLDGRPHPSEFAEHLWNGFSTGVWEKGMLKVTTTHMKQAFLQRNGIPSSPYGVMTEYFIRHGDRLLVMSQVDDPIYLEEPMVRTSTFKWNPGQRESADRAGGDRRGAARPQARRRAALSARLPADRLRRLERPAVGGRRSAAARRSIPSTPRSCSG